MSVIFAGTPKYDKQCGVCLAVASSFGMGAMLDPVLKKHRQSAGPAAPHAKLICKLGDAPN